ncbi:hypothetical protein AB0H77_35365 [Streptomyces sp. NPDC050844]
MTSPPTGAKGPCRRDVRFLWRSLRAVGAHLQVWERREFREVCGA